jgi:hypothetical protein
MSLNKVRNHVLALSLSQSSERRSFQWIEAIISIDQHDHIPLPFDHEILSIESYYACWMLMAMTIKRPKHLTSAIHACNLSIMQNTARSHQFLHRILSDSNQPWSNGSMPRSRL